MSPYSLDLVILAPGKDEKEMMDGLLSVRDSKLGIRPIKFEILVHPRRDPGCYQEAQDILRVYILQAAFALVLFDHEGSGQESRSGSELAQDVETRLRKNGWENRAKVLVLEPELETWVWSSDPEVSTIMGWTEKTLSLHQWLIKEGCWRKDQSKPNFPKETLIKTLRHTGVKRSSALYRQLAERVDFQGCQDPTFLQLREILISWFPRKKPQSNPHYS
jgi:hypothetical protein